MYPVIRAIPTSGTHSECYHGWMRHKPLIAKYSSQLTGTDHLDG